MTERDRLLKSLFETEGHSHLNIKFFRGLSDDISTEDLCREANAALFQFEKGLTEGRPEFGDADATSVDVNTLFS